MELKNFDYELPEELIAQGPLDERDSSRLMALDRSVGSISHRGFTDVLEYLASGDLLVLNDTKVVPARVFGRRKTGGVVEVLVIEHGPPEAPGGPEVAKCMIRPSRRLRAGTEVFFEGGAKALVTGRGPEGFFTCEFMGAGGVDGLLGGQGSMPLPPYIRRKSTVEDFDRYQTVFAEKEGAVAAPTAGLHFTEGLLEKIRRMGVEVRYITLHTGPGTFMPVKAEKIENHRMHRERYVMEPGVFDAVRRTKSESRRVIAVGSTSTRALEASVRKGFDAPELAGATDLFIYPGFRFQVVDAIITNFHLPRSTLIMLVAAFAGREFLMEAYNEAVRERYRFYSYGDAMLII